MKGLLFALFALVLLCTPVLAETPYTPPPEVEAEYGFSGLDESTMKSLFEQGTMIIVRQKPDLSLVNVTSGQLVNAKMDTVWATITDFENYPKFMPQTEDEQIIERQGEDFMIVEQTLGVKIWRLPAIDINYQLAQQLTRNNKVRFWHVSGPLEGTYGGWDLVPVRSPQEGFTDEQTMIFYTLYSNLTALGWGIGGIFKTQPDFMAGVNVTTAMMVTKAVKEESEQRAK